MERGTRLALSLAVPLLAGGCIDSLTAPARELPEQRGTQVGAAGGVAEGSAFAWSADGSAIFHRSSGETPTLVVASIQGGAPEPLVSAWENHRDPRAAPDGRSLYFVADTGSADVPVIFRLPLTAGAPVGLGRTAEEDEVTRRALGSAVLPAPGADTAALVVAPDSLFLDGPALRAFVTDGCERLIDFSPAGDRLLCLRTPGTSLQYRILDLASATFTNVEVEPDVDARLIDVLWTPGGILSLWLGPDGWGVRDPAADMERVIAPRPGNAFFADAANGALSDDGFHAAFWVHTCLETAGAGTCTRGQSVLHVIDLRDDSDAVAAVATGPSAASYVAFSPDGTRIAYLVEGTLYHVPVP